MNNITLTFNPPKPVPDADEDVLASVLRDDGSIELWEAHFEHGTWWSSNATMITSPIVSWARKPAGADLRQQPESDEAQVSDYQEALASVDALVRRLDVAINGSDAAPQARLCDIVSQVEREGLRPAQQATPEPVHPDDLAVDRFAEAMKSKLAASRAKGRGGWDDPDQCAVEHLARLLVEHIPKGDPVDVANFAMMLHQRGADRSVLAAATPEPVGAPISVAAVATVRGGKLSWLIEGGSADLPSGAVLLVADSPITDDCGSGEVYTHPAPGVPDVEAAAKKLAECMDYPWEHMPSAGRDNMRKHAEAVLAAAQAKGGAA